MTTIHKKKIITEDLQTLVPILKKGGVKSAALFGSHARGEGTPKSDVDILIEFAEPKGLFFFIGLERQLSECLKKKVDLVTRKSLSPFLQEEVLSSAKIFYEAR